MYMPYKKHYKILAKAGMVELLYGELLSQMKY